MLRQLEYKGHWINITVLPEQGRWAYRIDEGAVRALEITRTPMAPELLVREAELKAKAEVDRLVAAQNR